MKKAASIVIFALLAYYILNNPDVLLSPDGQADSNVPNASNNARLVQAYKNRQSDVQIKGEGVVERVLTDDNEGSRHQRFILRINSGLTVLIAHNIDLAPRVASPGVGDRVEFYGEYEWNDRGGVIHWTHHDPRGQHVGGWLKHNGQTFQ